MLSQHVVGRFLSATHKNFHIMSSIVRQMLITSAKSKHNLNLISNPLKPADDPSRQTGLKVYLELILAFNIPASVDRVCTTFSDV